MSNDNKKGRKAKETDYNNIFAVRLRELIKITGKKQQEIADSIGVSRQALNKWVNGETVPDIFSAAKIADLFNVSTDYLLGLSPTKSPDDKTKAACEVTGLEEEYIETLKAAVTERRKNRNKYEKTSIDAINALFYGITRQPDIISELTKLLEFDIDLLEMSEEESKQTEAKEINKALKGNGLYLSYSEYFDFVVQMIKSSCNEVIDIIVNRYFIPTPYYPANTFSESAANNIIEKLFVDKPNFLLESIKEDLENAHNNPTKE